MRVVYKKVHEELDELITQAALTGKRIARFELTEGEINELFRELSPMLVHRTYGRATTTSRYRDIPIVVAP